MIRTLLVAVAMASATASIAFSSISAQETAPQEPASACFNFRAVADYKLVQPGQIRIITKENKVFDMMLAGPGCDAVDLETIAKAPIVELCAGPQPIPRLLTFGRKDGSSIQCNIGSVSVAKSETAATPK